MISVGPNFASPEVISSLTKAIPIMDNALFVGLSRQMVLRREMDVIANNIANVDTTGFKVESMIQKTDPAAPAFTLGGPRPVKFVAADGVARDFGQGSLNPTGGALDMAIEGKAFFQVQGPEGPRFTRDGRFTTDATGRLVSQGGLPVLDKSGGEIVIDAEKGQVKVGGDGTLSQGNERVGQVGMFEFANLAALSKTGDNLYRNVSNLAATPSTEARLRQGMLEGSNVKSILEITRMVQVSRAYESTAKMMDAQSDLSRRAVERLGRTQ